PLRVPPLRERREDILPLALFFLDHFNRKFSREAGPLQPDAVAALEGANWAGNVRELKHTIERAVVVNTGGPIARADLGICLTEEPVLPTQPVPYREAHLRFERTYFANLLRQAEGNVSEASRLSGIARQNIYGHLERAGVVTKK
ncbi:MAG: sigma-54-dependent Fis family transcriptional regulator, partial [Ramlibacter sp.]|nr:sigma-54-dependent Fis family transcriptional regulator [Ramlibacter sp.]